MPTDKQPVAKKYSSLKNRISVKNDFYSDIAFKNMLYAITVRSPIERGIITSIFQETIPEGYYLFTARDVPGSNMLETPQGKISIFSEGNVSYKGEPIGILVGPDERTLIQIKNSLQINYDTNTIEDYLEPLNDGKTELTTPSSTQKSLIRGKDSNHIDDIFSTSEYVAEHEWTYNLNTPYYREPQGAVAHFDGEQLTLYTPTQWISNLRNALCQSTLIDTDNIIINKTKSYDHTTNSIWYNSIISCQVAVAAYHTKSYVKLVYTRQEQEEFIDCMMPIKFHYKTSMDETGLLTAVKARIELDTGSNNIFSNEIIDRLVISACGCYNSPNIDIHVNAKHSRKPPLSIDIQLLDSASFFAAENQINILSNMSGISPTEIRKVNLKETISEEKKEIDQTYPSFFYAPKAQETIDALINSSSFNRKYAAYKLNSFTRIKNGEHEFVASPNAAPLRGIGTACGFEGSFYYGSELYGSEQTLDVTLEENGTLTIHCSPISKPVQEIWTHLAADILGITVSSVKINSNFETDNEPLLPESAHANISILTGLLKKCCESIKRRKEGSEIPYTVKKKLTTQEKKNWNTENYTGEPFHRSSFAVAFVEVEFDPCTFRETIREINIVINGGKILNSVAAESSIRLGIEKVLRSLLEDDSIECNNIKISFVASEEEPSEIGKLVYQILPAAYTEAISQAIGKTIDKIPIKTDTLYNIIAKNYKTDSEEQEHANSTKS
ncbi:MAG: xanthine dehydrogenase family protein molybdopterin-binding subunit [Treponema sp.]|nr:xanthine dehydrogenase family protein molybdopterin-binding subunit [Treponema sp.]